MHAKHRSRQRRGAAMVEFAVVAPVLLLLVFAQIVGGLGIFRYQEVAHLARDGARYASTHGGMYQQEGIDQRTGVPAVTSSAQLSSYLAGEAVLLDPSQLQVNVSWTQPTTMPTYAVWNPNLTPPGYSNMQNYVMVTVTYQWFPELYLIGPITLTSTSEMQMSY